MLVTLLSVYLASTAVPAQHRKDAAAATRTCSSARAQLVLQDRELWIDGFLDEGVKRCFLALYNRNVVRLVVRSSGGLPEPALEMAERLAERRPEIRIRDVCGSACASLLLPTASKISADGPVLVLFHHTSTAAVESLATAPAALLRRYRDLSARELKLYATVGVSPWLLRVPFSAQQPRCFRIVPDDVSGASSDYMSRYQATLVDRKLLKAAGLKVPDTVADDEASFREGATKVLPDGGKMVLSGGIATLAADPRMTEADLRVQGQQKLPQLPMCE